jgi:geranylgeranyl pyrophosphate synthase
MLDFVGTEESLGKPVANDLRLGIATAPVLYAAKQFPELEALILRKFSQEGDIQRVDYHSQSHILSYTITITITITHTFIHNHNHNHTHIQTITIIFALSYYTCSLFLKENFQSSCYFISLTYFDLH